jgi:hypothetical protein
MAKATTGVTSVRKATKAELAKINAAAKANLEAPSKDLHVISDEQKAADAEANKQVKADAFSAFVAQGTGSGPALTTPPAAMEAFQKDLDALKAKHGVQATVSVKPAKADKKMQNGIVRPGENTVCGKIWATADAISLQMHGVCAIAALKEHPETKDVNDATLKTQYAKWRKFNFVTGRLPKLHAVHQVEGQYDGLAPIDQATKNAVAEALNALAGGKPKAE